MFKSQLEPSPESYESTAIFVENIFDTVKKAKAAKAAAKSLAESKLMPSYDYSFGNLSPVKKKRPRKGTKKNAKIKKPTSPKKKSPIRKPKALKDASEKRKKASPSKSPRKYTRRVPPKVPATADIDDEEAAFILSSISQRSFDSFYSRLNSSESNHIQIPLDPNPYSSSTVSSDILKNQAYYVMLDHNYWIVEPEVKEEPEIKAEPEADKTILNAVVIQPEDKAQPAIAPSEPDPEKKDDLDGCIVQILDKKIEVNNNNFNVKEKEEVHIEKTAVKKRWLQQAAKDMKNPKKCKIDEQKIELKSITEEIVSKKVKEEHKPKPIDLLEPEMKAESNGIAAEPSSEKPEVKIEVIPIENDKEKETKIEKLESIKTEQQETSVKEPVDQVVAGTKIAIEEKKPSDDKKPDDKQPVDKQPVDKQLDELDENDEKNWESVMNFHRTQLEILQQKNKRLPEKAVEHHKWNHKDHHIDSNYNRIPRMHSRFSLFDPIEKSDPRKTFARSCVSFEAENFSHRTSVSPFHRSNSDISLAEARKSRWSGNGMSTESTLSCLSSTLPFNAFLSEPAPFKKDEPYLKLSFNTQPLSSISTQPHSLEPLWENRVLSQAHQFRSDNSSDYINTESTAVEAFKAIESRSSILRKAAAPILPHTKVKASVFDPRLNPSLLQETKKDESAVPKKKVGKFSSSQ